MAWNDSYKDRFLLLLKNPSQYKKIKPFIKSRYFWYKRKILEFFNNETLSKPYIGHDTLIKYLNIEKGFFVVCGGNDGYFQDPTYYLERIKHWSGIIIEPLEIANLCAKNRPNSKIYRYAITDRIYPNNQISFIDINAMSFIKDDLPELKDWIKKGEIAQNIKSREIIVPTKKLQDILDDYSLETNKNIHIDLLTIDIEGYEINALRSLNFYKNSPTFILIEAHTEDKFKEIKSFLEKNNYSFISEIGHKDFLFKLRQ